MTWFFAILLVLALGGVALVASGWGTPLSRVYDDRPDVGVPAERELTGDDLRRVRFSLVLRGYRMSEVDELLARVAVQLEDAEKRERRANGGERGEDELP
jgi:DivIVA domain-containing protein